MKISPPKNSLQNKEKTERKRNSSNELPKIPFTLDFTSNVFFFFFFFPLIFPLNMLPSSLWKVSTHPKKKKKRMLPSFSLFFFSFSVNVLASFIIIFDFVWTCWLLFFLFFLVNSLGLKFLMLFIYLFFTLMKCVSIHNFFKV